MYLIHFQVHSQIMCNPLSNSLCACTNPESYYPLVVCLCLPYCGFFCVLLSFELINLFFFSRSCIAYYLTRICLLSNKVVQDIQILTPLDFNGYSYNGNVLHNPAPYFHILQMSKKLEHSNILLTIFILVNS